MCSPRSKPRRRYIHLSHGKIAISLIIPLSAPQSKSRCSPWVPSLYPSPHLLSFSSAPIPPSPIILTLSATFPLKIPYLFRACALALSAQCTVVLIHESVSYFYRSISVPFTCTDTDTPFFFGGGVIFCLFSHSRTISLSQTGGLNRGVGKVEKVTLEINGACISRASPSPGWFPPVL